MKNLEYATSLKKLLAVPSQYRMEKYMIEYIESYISGIPDIKYSIDALGNILITKGNANDKLYPLIMAHTDTVHVVPDKPELIKILSEVYPDGSKVKSWTGNEHDVSGYTKLWAEYAGNPYGCGGDNKTGIHISLELLKTYDKPLKVAFFVSEEIGMRGSMGSDPTFFTDVAYGLQFDAPCNDLVSSQLMGYRMFNPAGELGRIAQAAFDESGVEHYFEPHSYTDALQMKVRFGFDCINFSSGYYNMHKSTEYVILEHVIQANDIAERILNRVDTYKIYIS